MDTKQNTSGNNSKTEPFVMRPTEIVQNPNPKANENIRVRSDEPKTQNTELAHGVGSEITDGEDA
jgi:hypothetical protein